MDPTQAEITRASSDRTGVKGLESRVKCKKSDEYAPYGLLYMYFVATCVAKYAKFGWRLTPGPEDLMLGSQTVRTMAVRILSTQYKPIFQPTHRFQQQVSSRKMSTTG